MFSWDIDIFQQASHPIFSLEDGSRINTPKDVELGNHVWVGKRVGLLGGCKIGDNSVVGYGAVVSGTFESNCVIAGVPAKVIKKNTTWKRDVTGFYEISL